MVLAATKTDGTPDAAFIGFVCTDKLELVFGTSTRTRKYAALQNESRVAAVIGGQDKLTIQYEGTAEELSGEDLQTYREYYFEQNPAAKHFARDDTQRYFRITPSWIRYTNYNQGPPEIFELTDFNP